MMKGDQSCKNSIAFTAMIEERTQKFRWEFESNIAGVVKNYPNNGHEIKSLMRIIFADRKDFYKHVPYYFEKSAEKFHMQLFPILQAIDIIFGKYRNSECYDESCRKMMNRMTEKIINIVKWGVKSTNEGKSEICAYLRDEIERILIEWYKSSLFPNEDFKKYIKNLVTENLLVDSLNNPLNGDNEEFKFFDYQDIKNRNPDDSYMDTSIIVSPMGIPPYLVDSDGGHSKVGNNSSIQNIHEKSESAYCSSVKFTTGENNIFNMMTTLKKRKISSNDSCSSSLTPTSLNLINGNHLQQVPCNYRMKDSSFCTYFKKDVDESMTVDSRVTLDGNNKPIVTSSSSSSSMYMDNSPTTPVKVRRRCESRAPSSTPLGYGQFVIQHQLLDDKLSASHLHGKEEKEKEDGSGNDRLYHYNNWLQKSSQSLANYPNCQSLLG